MLDLRPLEPALWKAKSMKWRERINLTSVSPASNFDDQVTTILVNFITMILMHSVQDWGWGLKGTTQ
jgi:hypothetical protein